MSCLNSRSHLVSVESVDSRLISSSLKTGLLTCDRSPLISLGSSRPSSPLVLSRCNFQVELRLPTTSTFVSQLSSASTPYIFHQVSAAPQEPIRIPRVTHIRSSTPTPPKNTRLRYRLPPRRRSTITVVPSPARIHPAYPQSRQANTHL